MFCSYSSDCDESNGNVPTSKDASAIASAVYNNNAVPIASKGAARSTPARRVTRPSGDEPALLQKHVWTSTLPREAELSLLAMCNAIPVHKFKDNSSAGDTGFEAYEISNHVRKKFVWNQVVSTFINACPQVVREALRVNMLATRVSVNLINKGLPYHKDNVIPNQPDPDNCIPGLSISVHLGAPGDSPNPNPNPNPSGDSV